MQKCPVELRHSCPNTPIYANTELLFVTLENDVKEIDDFVSSGRGQTKKVLNPRGRPKLKEEELKQEQIVIHLTNEQKDEITKKAKQSSLSVSKYVLVKIFGIS